VVGIACDWFVILRRTVGIIFTTWLAFLYLKITPLTVVIQGNVADLICSLTWPILITFSLRYTELIFTDISILTVLIHAALWPVADKSISTADTADHVSHIWTVPILTALRIMAHIVNTCATDAVGTFRVLTTSRNTELVLTDVSLLAVIINAALWPAADEIVSIADTANQVSHVRTVSILAALGIVADMLNTSAADAVGTTGVVSTSNTADTREARGVAPLIVETVIICDASRVRGCGGCGGGSASCCRSRGRKDTVNNVRPVTDRTHRILISAIKR